MKDIAKLLLQRLLQQACQPRSMRIGYWTAQEQHSMQQVLDFVIEAERASFQTTSTSDHFTLGRTRIPMGILPGFGLLLGQSARKSYTS
jgi:hypothetical protein